MRWPLIALGVVILFVVGAVALVLDVGPLARPSAAPSVVFAAISRSNDEADAHEIEAVDLTAGTRALFDAGSRITAMALSADRRSLYVGVEHGTILLLDATTGSQFGAIDLGGPTDLGGPKVVSLVPTADGQTLFAVTDCVATGSCSVANVQSSVVPVDLSTKKAGAPIMFALTAGPAVLRDDALVVPLGNNTQLDVAFVDVNTRALRSTLNISLRGSFGSPAAFGLGGGRTGIVAFDGGGPGSEVIRVFVLSDPSHWRDVELESPHFPQSPSSDEPFRLDLEAAVAADGTVHVCATVGNLSRRYVVSADLKGAVAGSDCGFLVGGDKILMARRGVAQLLVLDDRSGTAVRTLALAGVPAELAH
jgi:hypothetical protein